MWIRALPNEARGARPNSVRQASFDAEHLEVRMFNVGHGEAILVILPAGRVWLVDGGNTNNKSPNDELADLIVKHLEARGLTLEACVASHAHVDHVGALDPILSSGSAVLAPVVTVYEASRGGTRTVGGWTVTALPSAILAELSKK